MAIVCAVRGLQTLAQQGNTDLWKNTRSPSGAASTRIVGTTTIFRVTSIRSGLARVINTSVARLHALLVAASGEEEQAATATGTVAVSCKQRTLHQAIVRR